MIELVNASDFYRSTQSSYEVFCNNQAFLSSHVKQVTHFSLLMDGSFWRDIYCPFACLIKNIPDNELILVRDHLGIAPLYYWFQPNRLVFGNNLPDILKYLNSIPKINKQELNRLFNNSPTYSDDTLFAGIKRVEPGHLIRIQANGRINKQAFWKLSAEGNPLIYKHDDDYLEHFSALLDESIVNATANHHKIAAEFSAGMDSTAVYAGCVAQNIHPDLFMHEAIEGSPSNKDYNNHYEQAILNYFNPQNLYRIKEKGFDPLNVFKKYSSWFAGTPAYIFDLFAHNLHTAVANKEHTILLSGFGGDQAVSGYASMRFSLPGIIRNEGFTKARRLLKDEKKGRNNSLLSSFKEELNLIRHASPVLYRGVQQVRQLLNNTQRVIGRGNQNNTLNQHPYSDCYFKTLREAEWSLLQGPLSREIRLRIESSSIVSKHFGFEYRYPLLYPKLLEFYLSVPFEQKRRLGSGRFLMRRYLEQQLPHAGFKHYQKKEGLHIVPATMEHYTQQFNQGSYDKVFNELNYPGNKKNNACSKIHSLKLIQAFMLQTYLENHIS